MAHATFLAGDVRRTPGSGSVAVPVGGCFEGLSRQLRGDQGAAYALEWFSGQGVSGPFVVYNEEAAAHEREIGWKSAKFLQVIWFMEQDRPGYWEERGYSNTADPWTKTALRAPLDL